MFNIKKHDVIELLWVGRLLKWKHPEKVIYVARKLKHDNYKFKIKMIGMGEYEDKIKKLTKKYKLDDCIEFLGSMPYETVRLYMKRSNIFLFTSDYHEGWGAVLNEAMSSACAVVASHAAGSTPFLVKHMENGLIFDSGNNADLYTQIKVLINDNQLCEMLGRNAYFTMLNQWNAEKAAEKFVDLCKKKLNLQSYIGENGTEPCSIALPTPQNKMYSLIMQGERS